MSTAIEDLQNNVKPEIRKISQGRVLTISIPLSISKKGNYRKGDYVYSFLDKNNRLIFEKVEKKQNEEGEIK